MKNLPDIVKFQYILSRRLNRLLTKDETKTKTYDKVISRSGMGIKYIISISDACNVNQ